MENLKYASELPYPTIEVEKNVAESKLLMPSYSGSAGELTAILTYAFQSYITPRYPEIAKAMEGVAVVEMHHHELLGKTIYALGGYPVMGGAHLVERQFCKLYAGPEKISHRKHQGGKKRNRQLRAHDSQPDRRECKNAFGAHNT